jgi:pimeloyl-ACP methyl ester carboxylesterase
MNDTQEHIVEMRGVPTWYMVTGSGPPLVMLHPGGADARALDGMLEPLGQYFRLYLPERRGHGRTPDVEGPIAFSDMTADTIAFIEQVVGEQVRLFGYSDGASVAIMVAAQRPDLVNRLLCAAGVYHHEGWHAGVIDLDAEPPDFMTESYGEVSPDGREHYAVVSKKLADAHLTEPALTEDDLSNITCRTLVMVADDDEVRLDHAVRWYESLPDGELMVVPGTSHGLIAEKPALFMDVVADFFLNDPVPTYAPLRRQPHNASYD